MAETNGRKGRMMLLGGAFGGAAALGWFEQRYPLQAGKIDAFAKLATIGASFMAIRGGKHAMKYAWVALVLGIPEARSFGAQLATGALAGTTGTSSGG